MKHIAILYGGFSGEAVVSAQSGKVVYKHLKGGKYNPILVEVNEKGWFAQIEDSSYPIDLNNFTALVNEETLSFDGAFIAIHGSPGENGIVQGYLDLIGMPYNSGSPLNSSLTFNKKFCNDVLKQAGVLAAKSISLTVGDDINENEIIDSIGLPCFVKPNGAGSSLGISKVITFEQLKPAIYKAFEEDETIVIEAFIEGTEVTCGMVNWKGELRALGVTEIVYQTEFFDYHAKYHDDKTQEITPARISEQQTQAVKDAAFKIYRLLRSRGMVRADFILKGDQPFLIEVNTVPGLSEASIIPKMAAYSGISLRELFENEVEMMLGE